MMNLKKTEQAATSFITRENNSSNVPSNEFSSNQHNPANAIFETLKDKTNEPMLKNIIEPLVQPLYRSSALEKQNEVKNAVIKQLQIQVDDLQQFSIGKSLRIDMITEENGEDAKQLVTQLVTHKMQVSHSHEDINLSYRVGKKTENMISPIMVKFSNLSFCRSLYQAKIKLHSVEVHPVYINEDLTKQRISLLHEARQLKRKRKIANAWNADGNIFIKETVDGIPINVEDNEDLAKYSSATYIDQPENEPTSTTSNEFPLTSNEFQ